MHWSSHDPASILHELVWHEDYKAMQFLIDPGIDMTMVPPKVGRITLQKTRGWRNGWPRRSDGGSRHRTENNQTAQAKS